MNRYYERYRVLGNNYWTQECFKNLEIVEDNYFDCISNFVHSGKFLNLLQKCVKTVYSTRELLK